MIDRYQDGKRNVFAAAALLLVVLCAAHSAIAGLFCTRSECMGLYGRPAGERRELLFTDRWYETSEFIVKIRFVPPRGQSIAHVVKFAKTDGSRCTPADAFTLMAATGLSWDDARVPVPGTNLHMQLVIDQRAVGEMDLIALATNATCGLVTGTVVFVSFPYSRAALGVCGE